MHVPAQQSSRLPLAAAVVALFASVVGVAHAVEFDEKLKAPQARSTEQLRVVAKAAGASFADATVDNREALVRDPANARRQFDARDRKSTRLNSSHSSISYAVFCLKKKKT